MNTAQEYFEMKNKYERGEIDSDTWAIYCETVLCKLMILNKEVLENLKNA